LNYPAGLKAIARLEQVDRRGPAGGARQRGAPGKGRSRRTARVPRPPRHPRRRVKGFGCAGDRPRARAPICDGAGARVDPAGRPRIGRVAPARVTRCPRVASQHRARPRARARRRGRDDAPPLRAERAARRRSASPSNTSSSTAAPVPSAAATLVVLTTWLGARTAALARARAARRRGARARLRAARLGAARRSGVDGVDPVDAVARGAIDGGGGGVVRARALSL
jgi:hypothetical protein